MLLIKDQIFTSFSPVYKFKSLIKSDSFNSPIRNAIQESSKILYFSFKSSFSKFNNISSKISSLYDEWKNDQPPLFTKGIAPSFSIVIESESIINLLTLSLSKYLIFNGTLQRELSVLPSIKYFF